MFALDLAVPGDSALGLPFLIHHSGFPTVGLNKKEHVFNLKNCHVLNFGN